MARYEKAEELLRLVLDLAGTAEGLTLADIMERLRVSRRTAERMRDAAARLFPALEEVDDGEARKRWRLPRGGAGRLADVTAGELAELRAAAALYRRDNRLSGAAALDRLAAKIAALLPPPVARRVAPDLEALAEAEGYAMRPGPKPRLAEEVLAALRRAILACRKVRLHYRGRESGALSRQIVCPYGFLYGHRHYLVAFSMNAQVRDYRLYSLAEIEKAEVTEWPFERRDFSLADYAAQSFGVFQEEPVEVAWRFSPAAARDARSFSFHPTQTIEAQADGTLVVRFRAGGMREMCWHLFTWGGEVEILEPEALRETYREMLEEAMGVAGNGTAARRCLTEGRRQ